MFFKVKSAASRGGSKRKALPRTPSGQLSRSYDRFKKENASIYLGPTVYFVSIGESDVVKIGHSKMPRFRFEQLKGTEKVTCYLLASIGFHKIKDAQTVERNIHALLKKRNRHVRGEMFMMSDADVGEMVDTVTRLMPKRIACIGRTEGTRATSGEPQVSIQTFFDTYHFDKIALDI